MRAMWGIRLDRDGDMPMKRQLFAALRERIWSGALAAGEELPSTRRLAEALGVSRNTVNEAFEMLLAEGYAVSRQGAPTRIADGVRLDPRSASAPRPPAPPPARLLADFRTGQPDLRTFPRYLWQQLAAKAMRDMPEPWLGYTGPQGLPRLREEIAAWLLRSKGLQADPSDLFITAGATHALHLAADLLYEPGLDLITEDPCHAEMIRVFLEKGYAAKRIPVDEHGMVTSRLGGRPGSPIYVTPSHQFPLGGILPAARRAELLRFARESGSYILEDDYDSEFRYYGDPATPLAAMDAERVVYIGTFSKALFPALRIGYAIVPRALQSRWTYARLHVDVQNPAFDQAVLAEFLAARKLDRHVARMRRLYRERRQALLEALSEQFGDRWRCWGDAAGLHLAVEFPGRRFGETFRELALLRGIRIVPLEQHCLQKGRHESKLLFGYGHLEPEEITAGMRALKALLDEAGS